MDPKAAPQGITLNNGVKMPLLGLGTYQARGKAARQAVVWALESGYRLIDTSLAYWNEPEVGRGIKASGLAREQLFITSKLENDDHGYASTLTACDRSLSNLQTDYLDLYLIHWPVPGKRDQTWRAMERLLAEGKCRAIGVSNYTTWHLEELLAEADVVPAVNQVEFHPFLNQQSLLRFCRSHDIVLEAYSPLVKARRMDDPVLNDIARAHGKTPAQVLIRWLLDQRIPAIPKSVQRTHIRENWNVWDFQLADADHRRLKRLNENRHYDWDPAFEV